MGPYDGGGSAFCVPESLAKKVDAALAKKKEPVTSGTQVRRGDSCTIRSHTRSV